MVWQHGISCTASSQRGSAKAEASTRSLNAQERSCVVCRKVGPSSHLLKFTYQQGMLLFGRGGKGRGAHVCPTPECVTGLNPGQLSRAFKKSIQIQESMPDMVERLGILAKQRIVETLGLARRAGVLEIGTDRVAEKLKGCMDRSNPGVAVAASDLAERTTKRLEGGWTFGSSQELGACIGVAKAGAIWVSASRFSKTLEFWLGCERAMGFALEAFQNETENKEG